MRALLCVSLVLASASADAYDSLACGPSLAPLRLDCDGITAARTPWVQSEHADIWLRARDLAGLPASLDEPFEVTTLLGNAIVRDNDNGEFPSFEVVPLPLVFETTARTMELSVFAQLPDKAYSLWDWTSGNESCPATDSADDVPECHKFEAHMGWLNSNHFLPQAGKVFRRYHDLALQRAGACQQMAATLSVAGRDEAGLLQACDREAMLLEAIAQHYLQDAWSMGHMWQRWGSPDLADFAASLSTRPDLGDIDAIGDAVGRGSGIIHGAKAITLFADAMCAPDDGIEFVFEGTTHAGAGDLFLERVEASERFVDQHDLLYGCSTTAMREVYLASAQSFGPAGASQAQDMDLNECFTQRATNRAVGLGSAIQIPIGLTNVGTAILPPSVALTLVLADTSDEYLRSLGLDSFGRSDFYIPLTAEMLTSVRIPGVGRLIPESVHTRWHDDMLRIQSVLSVGATEDPALTDLADGELGPLLGMEPNAIYEEKAARSSYADPPLPWTPTPTDQPLPSTVANAANILSRTFRDAHVEDWCAVLHENGDDEFSLTKLREVCTAKPGTADAVCAVCASFAEWMVFDPDPDAANPTLAQPPICTILANNPGIRVKSAPDDFDRAALAKRWCETKTITLSDSQSSGDVCNDLDTATASASVLVSGGDLPSGEWFLAVEAESAAVVETYVYDRLCGDPVPDNTCTNVLETERCEGESPPSPFATMSLADGAGAGVAATAGLVIPSGQQVTVAIPYEGSCIFEDHFAGTTCTTSQESGESSGSGTVTLRFDHVVGSGTMTVSFGAPLFLSTLQKTVPFGQ
jgi:hypothetical protein